MTLAQMIDAFQTINRAIPGIATAPASGATPQTLDAVSLPCALTLPGPASYQGRVWKSTRAYVVRVYVAPADHDAGVAFLAGLTLLDAVGACYRALPARVGAGVMHYAAGELSDAGFLATISYAGVAYFGVEFRITVQEPN
jgi:hypothetical protein